MACHRNKDITYLLTHLLTIASRRYDQTYLQLGDTLNCDITPLLKLLYNNNSHKHKAMSTISTIQNTNYQNTSYIQTTTLQKKLPTYQHE